MADDITPKPIDEDVRHDDLEFEPSLEPTKATAWLNMLEEAETAFEPWNLHCDKIDKLFADLTRLANMARDKEFQLFWANCEVLKPAIYAKAPVPIVVPKFKDRRPVYQAASELLERCAVVSFDLAYINELMIQVRDDLAILSRGVAWCRYESGGKGSYYDVEKVCVDFKHRRDFLHSLSRCWYEVTWVAAASYLTRAEARKRFKKYSGNAYQDAEYEVDKDTQSRGGTDNRERAKFWEIWHKPSRRVVWVACGVEDILDEDEPHLDLANYFPCPKPAYGTCQRYTLIPVPDVLQYKDQLDEVNMLTGRIHALSDALEAKGFYPAGGAEIAEAITTAITIKTPGRLLVPISNWAAFGGSKEVIIWLPVEQIATTITAVVALRKQVIDDVYQIMGLSDIMRGATDARETLGAQELKTQYGSTRVRDKQYELIRIARDLVCIICEIVTEKFDPVTIIQMSQTQLPTREMQAREVMGLQQQVQQITQAAQSPQALGMQQANPEQAKQLMEQAQAELTRLQTEISNTQGKPTIEQVLTFLKNNRARSFVLDIETDSTIQADENGEKERRTEFVQVLGALLPQLAQLMNADPHTAEFCGEVLKFATAPFRSGRALDGAIDELVEQMKARGQGQRPDDPTTATNKTALQIEQLKQQTQKEKNQADLQLKAQELQMKDAHEKAKIQSAERIKAAELRAKQGDDAAKVQLTNQKAMHDNEKHQMDVVGKEQDMQADARKMQMMEAAQIAKQADMAARVNERQQAAALKAQQPQGPVF